MPEPKSSNEISGILKDLQNQGGDALPQLLPFVYAELRRLAARHLQRERPGHSLQPTALVHEAYLKLVDADMTWQNRAHFFGVASRLMREILVEHARRRYALKRGGLSPRLRLDDVMAVATEQPGDVIALEEALGRLEQIDPKQGRIVELRYFVGLSVEETAEVLGIGARSVKREWMIARLWLHREIYGTA